MSDTGRDRTGDAGRRKGQKNLVNIMVISIFAVLVAASFLLDFGPGKELGASSWRFTKTMILMFPGAFILIGLFEAWLDREIVERHLGETGGFLSYFWVMLLAFTVMAPLIVALPIARSLHEKGARLQIVMGFIGFSTVCRIPMTIFEASYMGIPFSLVRFAVSLPLIVISAELLGRWFSMPAGDSAED